jgi:hypothetical protein
MGITTAEEAHLSTGNDGGRRASFALLALTLAQLREKGPGTNITVYDLKLGIVAQGEVKSVDDDQLELIDTSGHGQNNFTPHAAGLAGSAHTAAPDVITILTADLPELHDLLDDGSHGSEEGP